MARYCGIGEKGERLFDGVWGILLRDALASCDTIIADRHQTPQDADNSANFRFALMHMLRSFRLATADAEAYDIKVRLGGGISPGRSLFENVLGLDTGDWARAIEIVSALHEAMERSALFPSVLIIGESGYHEERLLAQLIRDLFVSQRGYEGFQIANAPWAYDTRVVGINQLLNSRFGGADIRLVNRDSPGAARFDNFLFRHVGYRAFAKVTWLRQLLDEDHIDARIKSVIRHIFQASSDDWSVFDVSTLPERAWLFLHGQPINSKNSEFPPIFEYLKSAAAPFNPSGYTLQDAPNPDDVFEDFILQGKDVFMGGSIHDLLLEEFWAGRRHAFVKIIDKGDFVGFENSILKHQRGGNVLLFSKRLDDHSDIKTLVQQLYAEVLNRIYFLTRHENTELQRAFHVYAATVLTPNHREKWNTKGTDTRWSFAGSFNGIVQLLQSEMEIIPATEPDRRPGKRSVSSSSQRGPLSA